MRDFANAVSGDFKKVLFLGAFFLNHALVVMSKWLAELALNIEVQCSRELAVLKFVRCQCKQNKKGG